MHNLGCQVGAPNPGEIFHFCTSWREGGREGETDSLVIYLHKESLGRKTWLLLSCKKNHNIIFHGKKRKGIDQQLWTKLKANTTWKFPDLIHLYAPLKMKMWHRLFLLLSICFYFHSLRKIIAPYFFCIRIVYFFKQTLRIYKATTF